MTKIVIAEAATTSRPRQPHLEVLLFVRIILSGFVTAVVFIVILFRLLFFRIIWHFNFLERSIWVDPKLLRHEPVHTIDKGRWIRDLVARLDEGSLEEYLRCVKSC